MFNKTVEHSSDSIFKRREPLEASPMAARRRTEINLEIHRRTTLYSHQIALREWCEGCQAQSVWLTPEGVAATTALSARQVYRYAEMGQAIFTETLQGTLFVCVRCLEQLTHTAPTPALPPASPVVSAAAVNPLRGLLHWLDADEDKAAEEYLHIHQRLTQYFQKHDPAQATELADEVLQRVTQQLQREHGAPTLFQGSNCLSYCYGIARNVLRELFRQAKRSPVVPLEDTGISLQIACLAAPSDQSEPDEQERRFALLEQGLAALTTEQRALVLQYYDREGRDRTQARRALAAQLGISENALRVRLCHIRRQLAEHLRASR